MNQQQQRAVIKQALEALELNNEEWKELADSGDCGFWKAEDQDHYKQTSASITALRQLLEAEPADEPDRLLLAAMNLARQQHSRIEELEALLAKAQPAPVHEPVACLSETQAKAILNLALHLETTGRCVAITEGQERADFVAINQNTQYALEDALRNATTPPAQPADHADELTIAYLDGVHTGKKIAKREWVVLTDEEIRLATDHIEPQHGLYWVIARAIEAKLREKNAPQPPIKHLPADDTEGGAA